MAWVILYYSLELLKWLIVIRAIMSWFVSPHSDNPFVDAIRRITDPILRPISELVPMSGIDLSPIIAFFLIVVLQRVVVGLA